jgi:hypothetical protein
MNKYTIKITLNTPHPSGEYEYINQEPIYVQDFTGDKEDISRIVRAVNHDTNYIPPVFPFLSDPNNFKIPSSCAKCGIKFDGVMGYVCSQPGCPTGLGGPQC